MSKNAYTVYIIHAPIIVFLALSLQGIIMNPLLKFALVAPLAVAVCFLIGNYIRKIVISPEYYVVLAPSKPISLPTNQY